MSEIDKLIELKKKELAELLAVKTKEAINFIVSEWKK